MQGFFLVFVWIRLDGSRPQVVSLRAPARPGPRLSAEARSTAPASVQVLSYDKRLNL